MAEPEIDSAVSKASQFLEQGNPSAAKAIYEATLHYHPQSDTIYQELAWIAQREYKWTQSQRYWERALRLATFNKGEISAKLGHLYHQWATDPFIPDPTKNKLAQRYFEQAQTFAPDNPVVLTYVGTWLLEQEDKISAERFYRQALEVDPRYVPAYLALTEFYRSVHDVSRAQETLMHALDLAPKDPLVYQELAEFLMQQGHPDDALKYALRSEQLDFGILPQRDVLKGKAYEQLGDLIQAKTTYEKVIALAPNHVPTLLSLAKLTEQLGQSEKSIAYYRQVVQLEPSLFKTLVKEAQTALQQEKTKEALPQFRKILAIQQGLEPLFQEETFPGDSLANQALHGIASAHFLNYFYRQANREELVEDLKYFDTPAVNLNHPLVQLDGLKLHIVFTREIAPETQTALETLAEGSHDLAAGEALFILNKFPQAQERLDAVDGETAQGYLLAANRLMLDQELWMSEALYRRGEQIEALTELQQGLKRIQAKRTLAEKKIAAGNALFDQKQYLQALPLYEEAQEIYRQWETPYLRLGDTYERLKQKPAAYQAYRQAVELSPQLLDSPKFAKKYQKLKKQAVNGSAS